MESLKRVQMLREEGLKFFHWNYFLALESDLARLSRYVELTEDNNDTYSIEMAHLLLAACSEVDVVLKRLCKKVNPKNSPRSIDGCRKILVSSFPKLATMEVRIPRYGLSIPTWENWKNDSNPNWWRAYNQVKHHRDEYFKEAKLQHTIASIAGLFVAVLFLYKEEAAEGKLTPLPILLSPPQECITLRGVSDDGVTLAYRV
jgi:hypothetical protein